MFNLPGFKKCFEAEGKAAPSSTETFENKQTAPTEDITSVLHFDPFKKGEEIPEGKTPSAKTAKEAKPEEGDEKTPAKDEKTNIPSPSTKPATEAKPSDDSGYWRGIAEERQKALDTATKPKEEPKADDGLKIPSYAFDIPDPLIEALTSQEVPTFKKGVQALAQGIAGAIHAQMAAHMSQTFDPRFNALPVIINQVIQATQKAKTISDDFYGKYPQFNHPQLKSIIKTTGEAVAKKLGKTEWDEELRDKIAEEMIAIFGNTGIKNGKDTNPPPRLLPSQGARTVPTTEDAVTKDIAETIFGQF